jgi:DNA primase
MAHQFGFDNVVATLGTSLTQGHARMLKRYAKTIVVIFDNDTAGIAAANRALELCLAQQIDIKIASVPEGKDPCEFLLTSGSDAFREMLSNATDVFEFKWARLQNSFDADNTIAGRKAAVNEFIQSIATAMSSGNLGAIEKGIIVNRLAGIVGADTSAINSQLTQRLRVARRNNAYQKAEQKSFSIDFGKGLFAAAQREIIEVLLNEPTLFPNVEGKIQPADFDVPVLKQAADIVFAALKENSEVSLTQILSRIEEPQLSSLIVNMQQTGQEKGNFDQRLTDAAAAFEKCLVEQKEQNTGKDSKIDIKDMAEKAQKGNPHSLGMV